MKIVQIRCQEFLNYIDTYFLLNETNFNNSERVLNTENQLKEYNQTIDQEITNVKFEVHRKRKTFISL